MRTFRPRHGKREGFTLIELLLVLALIVAMAGLSGPALSRSAANARLRDAARQLRAHWAQTRIDAMQYGTTFAWRYAPADSRYARMPYALPPWINTGDRETGLKSNQSTRADVSATVMDRLPDYVSFAEPDRFGSNLNSEESDPPLIDDSGSLGEGLNDSSEWSEPILFYPDGTTSDSVVVLRDERGNTLSVTLRGITGTASLGKVQTGTEEVLR